MKNEILNLTDVKQLVDTFYEKVREDELLNPIFNNVIKEHWPEHQEKMYKFWQTILLEEHTYFGSPFVPHAQLPVEKEHFDRWLQLFFSNIDDQFEGKKAQEAKWRGQKMAEMFQMKIEMNKNSNSTPLI